MWRFVALPEEAWTLHPESRSPAKCQICSPAGCHSRNVPWCALPIASHNLGPGLVMGWSGADQRFRLCPKSGPGVILHSDWRGISAVSASGIAHRSRDPFSRAGSNGIFHLGTSCAGVWWSEGSLRAGAASLLFLEHDVLS